MTEPTPLTPAWWDEIQRSYFGGDASPQQLVNFLDQHGWWPDEFLAHATAQAKLHAARAGLQRLQDAARGEAAREGSGPVPRRVTKEDR